MDISNRAGKAAANQLSSARSRCHLKQCTRVRHFGVANSLRCFDIASRSSGALADQLHNLLHFCSDWVIPSAKTYYTWLIDPTSVRRPKGEHHVGHHLDHHHRICGGHDRTLSLARSERIRKASSSRQCSGSPAHSLPHSSARRSAGTGLTKVPASSRRRSVRCSCCSSGTGWSPATSFAIQGISSNTDARDPAASSSRTTDWPAYLRLAGDTSTRITATENRRHIMGLLDVLKGMQNGPHGQPQPSKPGSGKSGGMSPLMMALLALLAYKAFKGSGSSHPSAAPAGTGKDLAHFLKAAGLETFWAGCCGGKPGAARAPGEPRRRPRRHSRRHARRRQAGRRRHARRRRWPWRYPGRHVRRQAGGAECQAAPECRAAPADLAAFSVACSVAARPAAVLSGGLDNLIKDLQANGYGKAAQSWVSTGPNESISPHDLESALGGDVLDSLAAQTGMSRSELMHGLSQELARGRQRTHAERTPADRSRKSRAGSEVQRHAA